MTALKDKLFQDLKNEILLLMPIQGETNKQAASELDAGELMVWWFNWIQRLIATTPRKVKVSEDAGIQILSPQIIDKVNYFFEKVRNGSDINPHLSDRIRFGYACPSDSYARPRTLDMMLNSFGIHHFHISGILQSNGFVVRDAPLIYAKVTHSDFFVLRVTGHGNWNDKSLLETAVSNFPDIMEHLEEIKGVVPIGHDYTSEEIRNANKGGITLIYKIGNKMYMVGGISAMKTPDIATMKSNKIKRRILELCKTGEVTYISKKGKHVKMSVPKKPEFGIKIILLEGYLRICLTEDISQQYITIDS